MEKQTISQRNTGTTSDKPSNASYNISSTVNCPEVRVAEDFTRTDRQCDPAHVHVPLLCILAVLDDHAPARRVNAWHSPPV
ncbi:hypothetical protein AVEN_215845-1 [Araneus ventricosus]|uniref:Uncharacterized protein n=1 Tax=Araneus ventricosus TaxID=182803 RepID=A0A4Y2LL89_ARAVE|nr:hypothetical protein AVEN_22970-1 [Araneus ventricosus]GBN14152.1 hypothetical protein AVEN_87557-1 [Araneus ventricosus]GBN14193.1 hypothetical protein AVEN_121841-1 [Araneus ventricosus]GBN14316.1 hypothetical protein AVEN_215845-1 [Araneus ventricosus]